VIVDGNFFEQFNNIFFQGLTGKDDYGFTGSKTSLTGAVGPSVILMPLPVTLYPVKASLPSFERVKASIFRPLNSGGST
jgi:hypothetical protein